MADINVLFNSKNLQSAQKSQAKLEDKQRKQEQQLLKSDGALLAKKEKITKQQVALRKMQNDQLKLQTKAEKLRATSAAKVKKLESGMGAGKDKDKAIKKQISTERAGTRDKLAGMNIEAKSLKKQERFQKANIKNARSDYALAKDKQSLLSGDLKDSKNLLKQRKGYLKVDKDLAKLGIDSNNLKGVSLKKGEELAQQIGRAQTLQQSQTKQRTRGLMNNLGIMFGMQAVAKRINGIISQSTQTFQQLNSTASQASVGLSSVQIAFKMIQFSIGESINALLTGFAPAIIQLGEDISDFFSTHDWAAGALLIVGGLAAGLGAAAQGALLANSIKGLLSSSVAKVAEKKIVGSVLGAGIGNSIITGLKGKGEDITTATSKAGTSTAKTFLTNFKTKMSTGLSSFTTTIAGFLASPAGLVVVGAAAVLVAGAFADKYDEAIDKWADEGSEDGGAGKKGVKGFLAVSADILRTIWNLGVMAAKVITNVLSFIVESIFKGLRAAWNWGMDLLGGWFKNFKIPGMDRIVDVIDAGADVFSAANKQMGWTMGWKDGKVEKRGGDGNFDNAVSDIVDNLNLSEKEKKANEFIKQMAKDRELYQGKMTEANTAYNDSMAKSAEVMPEVNEALDEYISNDSLQTELFVANLTAKTDANNAFINSEIKKKDVLEGKDVSGEGNFSSFADAVNAKTYYD